MYWNEGAVAFANVLSIPANLTLLIPMVASAMVENTVPVPGVWYAFTLINATLVTESIPNALVVVNLMV